MCLSILGASAAAIVVINQTEPTAQQIESTRRSAAIVETITVQRGTYSPRLVVLGSVQAASEIMLSPRVEGQVVELSPKFVPGGTVRKGDLLLRIDPAEFLNAVSVRESELAQVQASLEIEEGRQTLAQKELALLEANHRRSQPRPRTPRTANRLDAGRNQCGRGGRGTGPARLSWERC